MPVTFIVGSSGAGKSFHAYQTLIQEAVRMPSRQFYVIVPEQFTMQTQKTLVTMHPGGGILNIDVLSFKRLAYRVFEEVGSDTGQVLEDTGKSMLIRRISQEKKKDLPYLGSQMKKPGYIDEVKSLLSEFMEYDIRPQELSHIMEAAREDSLLGLKLKDLGKIYEVFTDYLRDHYITAEQLLQQLPMALSRSGRIAGSIMVFDGFTGFTPVQLSVIRELLSLCAQVRITVTMDLGENYLSAGKLHQLFYMSHRMISAVNRLGRQEAQIVRVSPGKSSRFGHAPSLRFLEENLFRYRKTVYGTEPREIRMFAAQTTVDELYEVARRISHLVRTQGCRYGDIALITGNLEEYADLVSQVFSQADIPFFLDQKRSALMNPAVEYLRAALDMVYQNFTYVSVMRFLRSQMTDFSLEDVDRLDNYLLALGIRGWKAWQKPWERTCRGYTAKDLKELNRMRETFIGMVKGLVEGFAGKAGRVKEYAECLYDFLWRSRLQQKLSDLEVMFLTQGRKDLAREYAQIYGAIIGLLDKMVEILGEESVSLEEFRQLAQTGLSQIEIGLIPASQDQVMVGDMERTRLRDVKVVFFTGVNEGNIPKSSDAGGFLTQTDRDFFQKEGVELAPGPKEQVSISRFYLYLNMTKPSRLLCLSYSLSNSKGEPLRPAYLVGMICQMFPLLKTVSVSDGQEQAENKRAGVRWLFSKMPQMPGKSPKEQEEFAGLYRWYLKDSYYGPLVRKLEEAAFAERPKDYLGRAVAAALYGEISPNSATRLEQYSACAFAHFLQYGLQLEERVEYEFKALDMGSVMHQALERFSEQIKEKGLSWVGIEDQERDTLLRDCVEQVSAEYGNTILASNERNRYMTERIQRILLRTVKILQAQLKNGSFEPESFELAVEGGRIDRVDIDESDGRIWIKVIDYKTGSTSFDLASVYHGLQLQLMIYLEAARAVEAEAHPGCEILPAGVFYYNIRDPYVEGSLDTTPEEAQEAIAKALKMNGLVMADVEIARRLDSTFQSLPLGVTKDGRFTRYSSVATREQFTLLGDYVREKIRRSIEEIQAGNALIQPYEWRNRTACDWCAYAGVCGFDQKIPGFSYHTLADYPDEEIWELLVQADKDNKR
ncbi:MAG: PD-(D/E)XK nuclease family protein [Blautia sp.]|nr:PD-(D/E)XK nuclease family protein [Blautia sp.]